jgi:hypothetical protein
MATAASQIIERIFRPIFRDQIARVRDLFFKHIPGHIQPRLQGIFEAGIGTEDDLLNELMPRLEEILGRHIEQIERRERARRGGRPRLADPRIPISARVTAAEYDQIASAARARGVSVSALVRAMIIRVTFRDKS